MMSATANPGANVARPSVLTLNFNSKASLYASYMPFLMHGGIFLPTAKEYKLGDNIFLLLQILDDPTRYPVAGKIAWITPAGAQGGRAQGVGVQFAGDTASKLLRDKIEKALAGALGSSRATYTI